MITPAEVFAEYVLENDNLMIDALNDYGVAFYHHARPDLKFSLALTPMFDVPTGHVGFIVTKHSYPWKDRLFCITNPELLDRVQNRVDAWLNGEEDGPL